MKYVLLEDSDIEYIKRKIRADFDAIDMSDPLAGMKAEALAMTLHRMGLFDEEKQLRDDFTFEMDKPKKTA